MNREDALKKIKKCLALARSAGSHEAAVALGQAQKLMQSFDVTDCELTMTDVQEVRVKGISAGLNTWELALVQITADAFGCEMFSERGGRITAAGSYVLERHWVFVGLESAPTVAGYALEVLLRQCAKARLAHIAKQPRNCKAITKTARGDTFAQGWVMAVADLVERFANPEKNETLLLAYLEAKHPNLKQSKTRNNAKGRKVPDGHLAAGLRAGESASLQRAMQGRAERRLIE